MNKLFAAMAFLTLSQMTVTVLHAGALTLPAAGDRIDTFRPAPYPHPYPFPGNQCPPGYRMEFDEYTGRYSCLPDHRWPQPLPLPEPQPLPKPWEDRGPIMEERERLDGMTTGIVGAQASLLKGDVGAASSSLGKLFDGLAKRGASLASPVVGGSAAPSAKFITGPFTAGGASFSKLEGRAVPAPYLEGRSARIVAVSDTDANPIQHDNARTGAGVWGGGGAIAGASGGAVGVVAGAVGGAIAGAVSGHIDDIKEKMAKDEKTYQEGTAAANRDHNK